MAYSSIRYGKVFLSKQKSFEQIAAKGSSLLFAAKCDWCSILPFASTVTIENGLNQSIVTTVANDWSEPELAAPKLAEIMKRCNPLTRDSEGAPGCQK